MTNKECHSYFLLELDKTNSANTTSFEHKEIDYWLNSAVDKFVTTRFTGTNNRRKGFEQDQKRIDDLHNLVTEKTYTLGAGGNYVVIRDDAFTFRVSYFPEDYMFQVGEAAVIYQKPKTKCWYWGDNHRATIDGVKTRISRLVSPISKKINNYKQELQNSLSDYRFNNGQAQPISVTKNEGVWLFTDEYYGVYQYIMTYIRKPEVINWYDEKGGAANPNRPYDDFDTRTWREIIKMAVQLALENISDFGRSQYAGVDVATQE